MDSSPGGLIGLMFAAFNLFFYPYLLIKISRQKKEVQNTLDQAPLEAGERAKAVIDWFWDTEVDLKDSALIAFNLTVYPHSQDPFCAYTAMPIKKLEVPNLKIGIDLWVLYDPQNLKKVKILEFTNIAFTPAELPPHKDTPQEREEKRLAKYNKLYKEGDPAEAEIIEIVAGPETGNMAKLTLLRLKIHPVYEPPFASQTVILEERAKGLKQKDRIKVHFNHKDPSEVVWDP